MVVQQATYTFGYYCSQILNFIFSNPVIQANPISLIFLISAIPSVFFPIPKAEFFIPIITNGGDAGAVILASTAGSIVSEIMLYYLAKHGISKFLLRKEASKDIEIKRFLHKYSFIFFLFSPFIPIGTDVLVLYAGIRKVKIHHFLLPMSVGFAIKNIIVVWLVLQGIYFLPIVSRICTG